MSKRKPSLPRSNPRLNRYFSESFKRAKVKEIEAGQTRVSDVCREYEVSHSAVYKWLHKYSRMRSMGARQIIEPMSDTTKIKSLKARIAELERMVGQKQVELEFKDKMIEIAEQMYDVDIKKKLGSKPSSGSGSTETNTAGQ